MTVKLPLLMLELLIMLVGEGTQDFLASLFQDVNAISFYSTL